MSRYLRIMLLSLTLCASFQAMDKRKFNNDYSDNIPSKTLAKKTLAKKHKIETPPLQALPSPLQFIPANVWCHITSFLDDDKSKANFTKTCKRFRDISAKYPIFRRIEIRYGTLVEQVNKATSVLESILKDKNRAYRNHLRTALKQKYSGKSDRQLLDRFKNSLLETRNLQNEEIEHSLKVISDMIPEKARNRLRNKLPLVRYLSFNGTLGIFLKSHCIKEISLTTLHTNPALIHYLSTHIGNTLINLNGCRDFLTLLVKMDKSFQNLFPNLQTLTIHNKYSEAGYYNIQNSYYPKENEWPELLKLPKGLTELQLSEAQPDFYYLHADPSRNRYFEAIINSCPNMKKLGLDLCFKPTPEIQDNKTISDLFTKLPPLLETFSLNWLIFKNSKNLQIVTVLEDKKSLIFKDNQYLQHLSQLPKLTQLTIQHQSFEYIHTPGRLFPKSLQTLILADIVFDQFLLNEITKLINLKTLSITQSILKVETEYATLSLTNSSLEHLTLNMSSSIAKGENTPVLEINCPQLPKPTLILERLIANVIKNSL